MTTKLTVAQALVRFLAAQRGRARRTPVPLLRRLPLASSVTATWPAWARRCSSTESCCPSTRPATSRPWSTSPPATPASATGWGPSPVPRRSDRGPRNMVTGAALATINRLPVLLLPGDTFATRTPHPVLQQLEDASRRHRVGQRLLPSRVPLLRASRAARAADSGCPGGDARAHRSGRDRCGDPGPTRGCADRGIRLAGGVPGAARLDRISPAAGRRGACTGPSS